MNSGRDKASNSKNVDASKSLQSTLKHRYSLKSTREQDSSNRKSKRHNNQNSKL